MKILLDECVDRRCKRFFSDEHFVRHVRDMKWLGIDNGELLERASEEFDLIFTVDANLPFQTSIAHLKIAVVVPAAVIDTLEDYQACILAIEERIHDFQIGKFSVIDWHQPHP
jgi:predicted nuclease of predicted toxin-antitoxin system